MSDKNRLGSVRVPALVCDKIKFKVGVSARLCLFITGCSGASRSSLTSQQPVQSS